MVVAIFCLCLGIIIDSRPLPEAKELAEVGEKNIYSKAKIYALIDYFATYGVDNDIVLFCFRRRCYIYFGFI